VKGAYSWPLFQCSPNLSWRQMPCQ